MVKGIVLAGGTGSRLWPLTESISKQLLPVYDKPMIYYPISTLMLAGIRDVLIITTPQDRNSFQNLLSDGSQFGISINYAVQEKPNGLAEALIIGETFLSGDSCLMILGDNIFYGGGLGHALENLKSSIGCHIFTYKVANPSDYGILTLDENGVPYSIIEKPKESKSDLAVTGLYLFDGEASQIAKKVKPSTRGELEITSVIQAYLDSKSLYVTHLSRGTAWLDTGNPESMLAASNFIHVIEARTGLKISCLEEIAYENGWTSYDQMKKAAVKYGKSNYGNYLSNIIARTVSESKLD